MLEFSGRPAQTADDELVRQNTTLTPKRVRTGDLLWRVARRYNTDVTQIMRHRDRRAAELF